MAFPLQESTSWRWRVRQLRHQYWKLVYSATELLAEPRGPLGEACAVGFASGTKVFKAGLLPALLAAVREEERWNWLLDLDLEIQSAGHEAWQ